MRQKEISNHYEEYEKVYLILGKRKADAEILGKSVLSKSGDVAHNQKIGILMCFVSNEK